jgi:hypothetical protein
MFGELRRKLGALDGCPRKWAAYYIEGNRPDFLGEHLVFGIKFHAVCASLVATGRMPEPRVLQPGAILTPTDCAPDGILGAMARSAIRHLPRSTVPETGDVIREWQVEKEWLFPWTTGTGLQVQVDLRPDVCADGTLIDLLDWKSCGGPRYALKSIVDDVQANLYAAGLMQRFGRDCVRGRWVYVNRTPSHKSWPVDGIFPWKETEAWLHENVDRTIELIHMFREMRPAALDVPGDIEACNGEGRQCDYAGPCLGQLGPREPRLITLAEIVRYKESTP